MFKSEYWYEIVKYKNDGERVERIIKDKDSAYSYATYLHNTNSNTEYPTITKKLLMIPIFNDYSILDVMGDCKSEILINIRERAQGLREAVQQFYSLTRKEKVYFKYALVSKPEQFDISNIYEGECIYLHPNYQIYQNIFEYNKMLYNIYRDEFENDVEYLKELFRELM